MSGTTTTPTVSGGSGGTTTTGSGSGSTTTSSGSGSNSTSPTYDYLVTQTGHGFDVGTLITDPTQIATLGLATATWAVRIEAGVFNPPAQGS